MTPPTHLPAPRRITASNLPLVKSNVAKPNSEPGVEVLVETLKLDPIPGGSLLRARVASSKKVPTSNDGHGHIELDQVPGMGIVRMSKPDNLLRGIIPTSLLSSTPKHKDVAYSGMPGGINMYYLDIAPNSEGAMHRTTSTDYLVVLQGTLSLLTPPKPFDVVDGRGTYGETVETLCEPGDVVLQRGIAHALSNRTTEWVRVMAVVVASEPNRVPVVGSGPVGQLKTVALDDVWLQ
ncbi:hypothetical protein K449DRAFT_437624 [Hypoxylon sp. EC38]|nr:hypothetical protein K449DRAFT_437624 [Hypoxylon sp. EC38]